MTLVVRMVLLVGLMIEGASMPSKAAGPHASFEIVTRMEIDVDGGQRRRLRCRHGTNEAVAPTGPGTQRAEPLFDDELREPALQRAAGECTR